MNPIRKAESLQWAGLRSRLLILARVGYLAVVLLTVGLYVLSIPAQARELQAICAGNCQYGQLTAGQVHELERWGLSLGAYAAYNLALSLIFFFVFVAVGVVIFARKSDDWFGIYVAIALPVFGLSFSNPLPLLAQQYAAFRLPLLLLSVLGGIVFGVFFYLFPDGHFVPRGSVWLIFLVAARELNYAFTPDSPLQYLFPIELASFILAQMYRYRYSSNAVQRQQTKWFVYGTSVGILGFGGLIIFVTTLSQSNQAPSIWVTLAGSAVLFSFISLIPLSIMMAILRSHLWDIDILIRRTLVYGALTVILALVYFGTVVILQELLRALTGQGSDVSIVVSTLAIAALFMPLRRRIQQVIDRRFYRSKYDMQQVLASFGSMARDEVDLDRLSTELVEVVERTMHPASVALWLAEPGAPRPVGVVSGEEER